MFMYISWIFPELSFIVEPCIDKISVSSNHLVHIFIRKHIKII